MLDNWLRDIRLGVRSLARAPLFTLAAVLTLGVGLGGTATLFSGVSTAYLRALPFPDEHRLTSVWQTRQDGSRIRVSMLNFIDWAELNNSFSHMAAYSNGFVNVTSGAEPVRTAAGFVTRDFFSVFGMSPRRGRTFSVEESVKTGPRAVVIGAELAARVYPRNPDPIGETLHIEGVPFQVIGVMPGGFEAPEKALLWLPLDPNDGSSRSAHNYQVVARLEESVSLDRARADMATIAARLAKAYPEENEEYGVAVVLLREDLLGRTGQVLLLLLGAVFLVLLIGCTNVVNLLLVRTLARQRDTQLRLAIGASRFALARPFLVEGLLLALLGGTFGLAMVYLGRRVIAAMLPVQVLSAEGVRVDGLILLFTLLLSLGVGALCGLTTTLQTSRTELRTALTAGLRSTSSNWYGMNALVASEVALACILLIAAGLLIRSTRSLEAVDPGFDPSGVALLHFSTGGMAGSRYDDPAWRVQFFDQLLKRATAVPDVRAAGAVTQAPLSGGSYNGTLLLEPRADEPIAEGYEAHYRLIGGDYFRALQIPLLGGRTFTQEDRESAPLVAMVNERLAWDLVQASEVLGRRVKIPGMDGIEEWATIVGVVADVRHRGLDRAAAPEIYFPYAQRPQRTWGMTVIARGRSEVSALARWLREEARELDPALPVELGTMAELIDRQLEQPRFRARLLGLFATSALLLASIGTFGVISYTVEGRNREVGIRMALGADRTSVYLLVLYSGMAPVLAGIVLGTLAALVIIQFLENLVFGVPLRDPATFGGVILLLCTTGLLASYLPARRASRVQPIEVLRAE